jgi:hypothetical protein
MTNIEPTCELLRLSDVRAWIPSIDKRLLKKWEEAGVIRTIKILPNSKRFYVKSSILKLIRENDHA